MCCDGLKGDTERYEENEVENSSPRHATNRLIRWLTSEARGAEPHRKEVSRWKAVLLPVVQVVVTEGVHRRGSPLCSAELSSVSWVCTGAHTRLWWGVREGRLESE